MSGDGAHDFDFNFGVWNTHIKRFLHPLSGSTDAVELNGVVTVRKVWGGRAQFEEIEADGPTGHWEGMTLFLYNPASQQWSQTFFNSTTGIQSGGLIGAFKDGRGELFAPDTLDGKAILVRGVWSDITPTSHHYEEFYSSDGGSTWEPAFDANLTRKQPPASTVAPEASAEQTAVRRYDGSHDFDFDFGTWKTHTSRLLHPLTGSTDWVAFDGFTMVSKFWGGRANLAEYSADGPAGRLELLAIRTYNSKTSQWNLNFANPSVGMLGVPGIGDFKDRRVEFYDQEPINGKSVLVRFSIWGITPDTAQSEQAFSADGGTTWETNWINKYTRARS